MSMWLIPATGVAAATSAAGPCSSLPDGVALVVPHGAGVAVVVGMANAKGTDKGGKEFDRTYRFTDTWIDRGGNWQCIASHATLIGQR